MTREEAIQILRTQYPHDAVVKKALGLLIPELRESEDENLKNKSGYYKAGKFWKASTLWNATKDKIPQRVSNRYILQECTWNIGTLQRFADEIKNVQEVSLDYPIILDINGNILDGAHRVVKAYLEGKDIDVVYLGDDEWPEPDYDEEKAVRESEDERVIEEIKFAVMQMPSERQDTKNRCLAWLEKQKERKFDFELIKQAWYMEGYKDRDFETEPRWIIKTGEGGPEYELNPKYGQPLAKMQKPAEIDFEDWDTLGYIRDIVRKHVRRDEEFNALDKWLTEHYVNQKPAEWSEKEEKILDSLIRLYSKEYSSYAWPWANGAFTYGDVVNFLKSLHPDSYKNCNSRWKPSEEQMKALNAMNCCGELSYQGQQQLLIDLYQQLKKL